MCNALSRRKLCCALLALFSITGIESGNASLFAAAIPLGSTHRIYVDGLVTSDPEEVFDWIGNGFPLGLGLPTPGLLGATVSGYFEYNSMATGRLILGDAVREFAWSAINLEIRDPANNLIHAISTAPNGFRVVDGNVHLFLGPSAPSQPGYQLLRPTDIRINLLGNQFASQNLFPPTPAELLRGTIDQVLDPTIQIDRTNPPQTASGWTVPFESLRLYQIPEPSALLLLAIPVVMCVLKRSAWDRLGFSAP